MQKYFHRTADLDTPYILYKGILWVGSLKEAEIKDIADRNQKIPPQDSGECISKIIMLNTVNSSKRSLRIRTLF